MKVHIVENGLFKLDGGAMFGVVPKTMWQKLNPPDDNNLCTWTMRSLLVDYGDRKVLIDTGLGNKQSDKFFSYYEPHGEDTLETSLQKLGLEKKDITDVFLTHLHFDHCGGAVEKQGEKLVPAFKNATYWSNQSHWEWATNPNPREKASFLKENILPIQESGQLQFVKEEDGIALFPGFKVFFVNGHTQAMMLPQIEKAEKKLFYMADLIPSVNHIGLPYVMAYDTRPLLSIEEKKHHLARAAENEMVLVFEHDHQHECCTVKQTERGVRAKDSGLLRDFFN